MGTHQQLTTEQVEVLILIDEINMIMGGNITKDSVVESMSDIVQTKKEISDIYVMLEYYGYIKESNNETTGYIVTLDGRQYIQLFKEYLKAKAENPKVVHNNFSLINIGKVKIDLNRKLEICGIKVEVSEIVDLAKKALDSISSIVEWTKKKIKKQEQE